MKKAKNKNRKTMNEKPSPRFLNARSDNLKSKIRNPKWVGIVALGVTFVMCGAVAQAQQGTKIPQIGFLSTSGERHVKTLRESLSELGYVDGKNITIVPRTAKRKFERLPKLAAELVDLKVDVIVAAQGRAGQAAKKATSTTPIVVLTGSDLVQSGLVTSLARPGANVTGFSLYTVELGRKLLELLKEASPKVSRVGVLWHPANPTGLPTFRQIETIAPMLGVEIHSMKVRGDTPHPDFDRAFQAASEKRVDAFIVVAVSSSYRKPVLKHIAKTQLPAIYYRDSWVRSGGLMFYGPRRRDLFPLAAQYVDRILKGAKPGDLPVQRATQFHLVINLKTARKLGITFSPEFLARADEVIR